VTPLLWTDLVALVVCSIVALRDVDVELRGVRVGRPVFGAFVLVGLVGVYVAVVREGFVPAPGYGVVGFALLYLPFLSTAFIDLETTDRFAREQLEALLLERDLARLRHASGHDVLVCGRRRLKMHWEAREAPDSGIVVELDVHPSTLPLTVSRPHVAEIRDQIHLEFIRQEIRKRREQAQNS
jgi:hypothetical protein